MAPPPRAAGDADLIAQASSLPGAGEPALGPTEASDAGEEGPSSEALLRACFKVLGQLGRGCGRPLGPASLVTRSDAAAELRCDHRRLDAALSRCRPVQPGRYALYVWQDVLGALRAMDEGAVSTAETSSPGEPMPGLARGGLRRAG